MKMLEPKIPIQTIDANIIRYFSFSMVHDYEARIFFVSIDDIGNAQRKRDIREMMFKEVKKMKYQGFLSKLFRRR